MKTKIRYVKPTIEVITIELEASVLSGSNQSSGTGWG